MFPVNVRIFVAGIMRIFVEWNVGGVSFEGRIALWVEHGQADGFPVSSVASPTFSVFLASLFIERFARAIVTVPVTFSLSTKGMKLYESRYEEIDRFSGTARG